MPIHPIARFVGVAPRDIGPACIPARLLGMHRHNPLLTATIPIFMLLVNLTSHSATCLSLISPADSIILLRTLDRILNPPLLQIHRLERKVVLDIIVIVNT